MTLNLVGTESARVLLDRLLDRPAPLPAVQSLSAPTLLRLIERVGLEDLGQLVSLLSLAQLEQVLDQELWTLERPGRDQRFDAERFALWLAVLVEHDPRLAAEKLKELDFELVALGVSRHLYVIDVERLAQTLAHGERGEEDELLEKALESGPYHELEQYRLIARDSRSFDALLAILLELNTYDYGFLCELLERCCDISTELIEDNGGLYEVLTCAEMVESDVAGERELRREARGFIAPSSALAFLKLAQQTPLDELLASDAPDPITRAYFRAVQPPQAAVSRPMRSDHALLSSATQLPLGGAAADASTVRLLAALETVVSEPALATLKLASGPAGRASLLARALRVLCERDPRAYERCLLEASYLANVVLAGIGTESERLVPAEAAQLALSVCELGASLLARVATKRGAAQQNVVVDRLATNGLVTLFQVGFKRLCSGALSTRGRQNKTLKRLQRLLEAQGLARPGA